MVEAKAVSYGAVASTPQIERFLDINFTLNEKARQNGEPGRVPFIWGNKGIGKTETVRGWAKKRGYDFIEVPLAQFEEMGDINGFPYLEEVEKDGKIIKETKCAPPDWVPRHIPNKGGILFFDDGNRAEPRLQRGLMQLYQTYGMVSWKIPDKWMIVVTGNPENGEYDVSGMDEAQVTRLNHIQMKFDMKSWAKWAEENKIHPEGIKFVIKYPEMVDRADSGRTCPRTLVEFFRSLEQLGRTPAELKTCLDMVHLFGEASLEPETVTTFTTFLTSDAELALDPEVILKDSDATLKHIEKLKKMKPRRSDILTIMATRLINTILPKEFELTKEKGKALLAFLRSSLQENDLGLDKELAVMIIRDINNSDNDKLQKLWASDKQLVKMVADSTN